MLTLAADLPADHASAARTLEPDLIGLLDPNEPRSGRVVLIRYREDAGSSLESQSLMDVTPTIVATRLCEALGRRPGVLIVREGGTGGWPVQVVLAAGQRGGAAAQVLAHMAADPPAPALAERVAAALDDLHDDGWWPLTLPAAAKARAVAAKAGRPLDRKALRAVRPDPHLSVVEED